MDEWYNAQIKKVFALVLCLLGIFTSRVSALPQPEASPEYPARIFADVSYFDSKANYDINGGSYVDLINGRYYKSVLGEFGFEYWLMNDFSVIAQLGVNRAESYDGVFTRESTEATDLLVGGRFVAMRLPVILIPELWVSYPFNKFDETTDEVLTGEGVMRGFAGLWVELPIHQFFPYAEVGYLHQDGGRAGLFQYQAGVNWKIPSFKIGGGAYGSIVVVHDDLQDTRVLRDTVTQRVNGGSYKYYSVDPSVLGLEAHASFDMNENFRFNAGIDKTINGEASAAGWTAKIGLEFMFDSDGADRSERISSPEVLEEAPAEEKSFEPEQTNYDKELFNEPKIKPKKFKVKRSKPRPKPVDVDKSLDDVQKSLEGK